MLKTIVNALAAGIAAVFSGMAAVTKWGFQMARGIVRLPFDLLGGGQPIPAPYEPEVKQADILDEFLEARKRSAAVHTLDREGIDTVIQYCNTHREDRPRFVLPKTLDRDVLVALRTMDDAALRALATSGVSKIRKFIDGREHDIYGVPSLAKVKPQSLPKAPAGMTEHERIMWKVKARLEKAHEYEPFAIRKR
ncbi:hypothetical protein IFT59_07125 [Rhizobium sp. CFBP 8752]|uniref:hypothetical protein n=1 Tax=Rhizobium sp. CFBP 8752 TaxID=2775301 RepID=UPI0017824312|nr:hypothetical protein [Rhizobium sp. CFBP 8752]MBD8663023.1 hypothetical protein [Rhizobium sp. CFBP 8752]